MISAAAKQHLALREKVRRYVIAKQDLAPPTIRAVARRFSVSQQTVFDAAEDDGLNINVGFQIFGSGYADLELADMTLECLNP